LRPVAFHIGSLKKVCSIKTKYKNVMAIKTLIKIKCHKLIKYNTPTEGTMYRI
jgi:hypothetical protein